MKTGILVVNLGTTLSYNRRDVVQYLREFLMDERVIDIPFWKRWLLVNLIIVPFRATRVSKEYQKLWLKDGSPLLVYGKRFAEKLQTFYPVNEAKVVLAMRYQQPSIKEGLEELRKYGTERIVVFPLFPQYASATTGSIAEKVMKTVSEWNVIPGIQFINSYHRDQNYIQVFAKKVRKDIEEFQPDHILFSYHGLPERQLLKTNEGEAIYCTFPNCDCFAGEFTYPYCYRSACFETSDLISRELGLKQTKFTTSFQSRLGKEPWIKPYTDERIVNLCNQGIKKLLVVSPSFVADCLETTLEIGEQYQDLFLNSGGQAFRLTSSLNDEDEWIEAAYKIIALGKGNIQTIQ
jgi:ferrochelatase